MSAVLEPGDVLTTVELLAAAGGEPVRLGARRRRSQVVVLTHPEPCPDCEAYVASLETALERVRAEKGDVLVVVGPGWRDRPPSLPVSVLVDDGSLGPRLAPDGTPVVAVADRFGQVFSRFDAGADHSFPAHDRVVATLLDIAIRCPECGVPDVPCWTVFPEPGTTSGGMVLGG